MKHDLPIKLDLPEGFLDPEVRCGYEVPTKLKKIWAVELDLLNEFQKVCAKYNIKYQVFAGTLLGAVRHKGFIPWDDDLDVCLSRSEFDKLVAVAQKEFSHPYFFQTAHTDKLYFFSYARLRNSQTTGVISGTTERPYNGGIYIDIYVLDGYPDSLWLYRFQLLFKKFIVKLLTLYYCEQPRNKSIMELAMHRLRPFARLFKYETLLKVHKWVTTWFDNRSSRICEVAHLDWSGWKYWLYKVEFEESVSSPYEMLQVPIPKDYNDVLTRIYGEYMSFPPVEIRGKWHEGVIHFDPDVPYKEYLARLDNDSK